MADLDTLRPEVKEALDWFVARRHFGTNGDGHLKTIRAELLRLAMIEADALIALDCEHDWQVEHERAEKAEAELDALKNLQYELAAQVTRANNAEAELAALKARIANSPIVEIANYGDPFIVLPDHLTVPDSLKGKRVRLVVEE